ncbi:hypothetical protein [Profundibacterium mesophilum]|uniref:Uncharacterized protein n=1 Tax=Profundibacterium mesophilum KAUST100406-0324 TaxID=1037889 RepID=A0A921NV14_9RHOB|nr:hypothetical protein [Profundibacterium mesophilum]KAF0676015.1 hypothetical protein PMES_01579 [Profundibacterium mesophilum KAUST100406-0324]
MIETKFRADRLAGPLLIALTGLAIAREWNAAPQAVILAVAVLLPVSVALLATSIRPGRRIFVLVALLLSAAALVLLENWQTVLLSALGTSVFIAGFFSALATLRSAADSSPSIRACGRYLAQQPPGRRYAALTVGGQLFALLLNYGAIALLGSLAVANADEDKNPEIRAVRTRRMLLAIQRGFISVLAWSPLSFAVAISTSLIPGTSWTGAVLPSLVTGGLVAGLGWLLDTAFKPRLSTKVPERRAPDGTWRLLLPLVALLALLAICVLILFLATRIRVPGLVMMIVPAIAAGWIALQNRDAPLAALRHRSARFTFTELPAYRDELVLLMMAGFIGSVGGALLVPVVAHGDIDLTALPGWLILLSLVWVIPAAGQVGMNPILAVSLLVPLLPDAQSLGVSPTALLIAITAGWTMSGACSPYTATTLLVGSFGGVSAAHVGLRWNGVYTLLGGSLLSIWVLSYAYLL